MITKLKDLWQQAFGDSRESIDAFFTTAYDSLRCQVVLHRGEVASALYWLDYTWEDKKLAYIYAVATQEDLRGQGYGRQLMENTHKVLCQQGYWGAVLVPGDAGLAKMYEKLGYRKFYDARLTEIPAATPWEIKKISSEEYAVLRQEMKPDAPQPGKEVYDYFSTYGSYYQAEGCIFAASRQKDTAYFQEFLGDTQKLPHIAGGLNAKMGVARIPEAGVAFAMYYPLNGVKMPEYFCFALD